MSETVETIAFLGAGGTMGHGMAANLLAAGMPVRAWNRSRAKAEPLAQRGADVLDDPRQAVAEASIVVTMLPDADAVLHLAGEALEHAPSGLIWIQMSTIGVDGTERCAALAERRGVTFVDAPVQGTKQPAEKGELVVLASGPEQARERIEPVFDAVGKKTVWLGEAGSGTRLKMVTNSWLVTVVQGLAETLALAEAADLNPQSFLDVISGGPLDAPYMQMKAKAMIERDFEPSFRLALAAKDAQLANEMAERHELDLPTLRVIRDRLAEAAERYGDEDVAATFLTRAPGSAAR
jgi:3-hydroxyisobutyrate dehydrogenase